MRCACFKNLLIVELITKITKSVNSKGCSGGEAGSSDTESDLTKIASEIDKLTKGDNELSNAAVTQLANDISKLLAGIYSLFIMDRVIKLNVSLYFN